MSDGSFTLSASGVTQLVRSVRGGECAISMAVEAYKQTYTADGDGDTASRAALDMIGLIAEQVARDILCQLPADEP